MIRLYRSWQICRNYCRCSEPAAVVFAPSFLNCFSALQLYHICVVTPQNEPLQLLQKAFLLSFPVETHLRQPPHHPPDAHNISLLRNICVHIQHISEEALCVRSVSHTASRPHCSSRVLSSNCLTQTVVTSPLKGSVCVYVHVCLLMCVCDL